MSETQESEAIERFCEGLKQASDCLHRMCQPWMYPGETKKFATAMGDAAGSAYQLAIMQQNPAFYGIRDQIETMMKSIAEMAISLQFKEIRPQQTKDAFRGVSKVLILLAVKGKQIATSKPLSRNEVLNILDVNQGVAAAKSDAEQEAKKKIVLH